ncbi:MAG: ParB/RepB/Spo0J family partition protein [Gammaproteobacteria bacterium]|nr:ParB/RepB/Spo0J family partition protein [Gammaproteobacteria bacterium]MCW9006114.1 ParB/RepB/Spo0J family partition protein [Gammaproteobacteria bacterium]
MSAKKRGLGRGLNALLGNAAEVKQLTDPAPTSTLEAQVTSLQSGMQNIGVDLIQRGIYQPRVHFEPEALQDLAESIKSQGVIQPIVVRPIGSGKYELIAGERRWRASQLAGMDEVPAVIRELDDQTAAAISLIENIQREDLNPLEESRALQRLIDEFSMTHQQVAEVVGRSRAAVTNLLRLRDLNEDVKKLVDEGKLEMGHARALLGLSGTEQSQLARKVAESGKSVRETEQMVRRQLNPEQHVKKKSTLDPDTRRLKDELSERLGAAVDLQHTNSGKGKLVISYNSLDELDGILSKIH